MTDYSQNFYLQFIYCKGCDSLRIEYLEFGNKSGGGSIYSLKEVYGQCKTSTVAQSSDNVQKMPSGFFQKRPHLGISVL